MLTALAAGSQHGYALIREVEQASHGAVRLRTGTLYTALDRLESEGLVSVARAEVVAGRRRRYYELTAQGARRLKEETARLAGNVRRAQRALHLRAATA